MTQCWGAPERMGPHPPPWLPLLKGSSILSTSLGSKTLNTSLGLVCWNLTSLCHSNGHIETMPTREINPSTALTGIRSQFLGTRWRAIISEWTRLCLRPLSHRDWQHLLGTGGTKIKDPVVCATWPGFHSPPPPPLGAFRHDAVPTRQSEMANTSPCHMPVTSFLCSLEFLYFFWIGSATQEVPIQNIWKKLSVKFLAPLCHLAAELFKCRLVRRRRRRRRRQL